LGDHLLANRFVPAILDRYPDASIKVFSDTEGNGKSAELLLSLFGRFYSRGIEVIESRASKEYPVRSQFGEENYPAHINNQKPEVLRAMLDCEKFYDFHIDGLKWLDYKELGLLNYFYHFPYPNLPPTTKLDVDTGTPFVLTHLLSRPDSGHGLEPWYMERLLKKLAENQRVIAICESKYFSHYEFARSFSNVEIVDPNTAECFILAKQCEAFIGVDSGLRYMPMHFGKPTFVFSKYSKSPHQAPISHLIRWLIHEKFVLPNEMDVEKVNGVIDNAILNPLVPEISKNLIDQTIIHRKYDVGTRSN